MRFSHKTGSHTILRSLLLTAAFWLPFQGVAISPSAAATPSPSSPRLVGTVESGPFSGAVFDDGTGVQTFYRLHEKLPDGSAVVKVRSDSILIRKEDGLLYEMFTSGSANSAATALPAQIISPTMPQPTETDSGTPIRPKGRLGRTPQPDE